jgi:multidrug efflux pump subunit AcrA (membrane-fusion protein)
MVSDVKTAPSAQLRMAARIAALGLVIFASVGGSAPARAENEFERLWDDVRGRKPAPAPTPQTPSAQTPGPQAPPPQTQSPAAPAAPSAPAQPVSAPAAAQPAAALMIPVVLPKVQAVSETLTLTGNAEAVSQVKLVARVPGYLEQIHFQDGAIVKKDDLLFTVQQDQYQAQLQQAQAQLEAATVARDHARLEVGRYTALLRRHATSQVDVDHWVFE